MTYNETTLASSISSDSTSFLWIASDEDGQYIVQDSNSALLIKHIVKDSEKILVAADKIPDNTHDYWIKPDLSAVLFVTNYTKQYRHSYFSNYPIYNVEKGLTTPLVNDQHSDLQYAAWSLMENQIAYVRDNNLFMWKDGESTQITDDSGPNMFNGVPNWVYKKEIFGNWFTLWFSPDGKYLTYLSFNEMGVDFFTIQYYLDNQDIAPPYPHELDIRYPKVSTTNPTVQFNLLNIKTTETTKVPTDAFPTHDMIIGEVTWVTDAHNSILFRAYNRVQDHEKIITVDIESSQGSVVRERDGSDRWLDNLLAILYISKAQEKGK